MPPVGFEPTISAGERLQTYALDRAVTGTGTRITLTFIIRVDHLTYLSLRASAATVLCQVFVSCWGCFFWNGVALRQVPHFAGLPLKNSSCLTMIAQL